jgi:P-type Cu+ transporter
MSSAEHAHTHSHVHGAGDLVYTCPMHPEVQQNHPGSCPKCGMTLKPQGEVSSHERPQPADAHHEGHDHSAHSAEHVHSAHVQRSPIPPQTAPSAPNQGAATTGTEYTCPMHPEVRQDHPGNCPKCGMTLEPVIPELDDSENPELVDFQRRFWWTLPLTVVVTTLAMFGHQLGWFDVGTQTWVELVLSLPIVLWAGWPFFARGWQSIVNRSPNMWTLIGLGTGAAFLYSVVATVAPQVFPESFISMGRIGVYFEAAAVIISLTLLGQVLELKARSQTSAAIKSLLGLAPKTARRIRDDGTEEDVPLTHVHVGDVLRVRRGHRRGQRCR